MMITGDFKMRMPAEFEPHDGCVMIWPLKDQTNDLADQTGLVDL